MAAHFKVLVHPNGNSVHLNPMGTFDPGSARELTDVIKRFQDRGRRIFVHTNGISTVDAAGQAEYLRRIAAMNPGAQSVIVTG